MRGVGVALKSRAECARGKRRIGVVVGRIFGKTHKQQRQAAQAVDVEPSEIRPDKQAVAQHLRTGVMSVGKCLLGLGDGVFRHHVAAASRNHRNGGKQQTENKYQKVFQFYFYLEGGVSVGTSGSVTTSRSV